jgi:two-component system, OmpR family, sensor kinase
VVQVSLRARLTAWYSVLLVFTVAVFSVSVLWLHWRLLLEQFDEGLDATSATADNVVEEELRELRDLRLAAAEMVSVVHPADDIVQVLDVHGTPMNQPPRRMPLPPAFFGSGADAGTLTLTGDDGQRWRVNVRSRVTDGTGYYVVVGAPLDEAIEQWRRLLQACVIGIPLALVCAGLGGLWVVRYGLRPLTAMAAEAQAITASTLDRRLTVPSATQEFAQIAASFNHVLGRLGSALSTQRRFMADASHELRTPVSIMRTAADVTLSQPTRAEAEYRDALTAVAQQASRLTRLVDDMMVLARADGGGYPITFAAVDLSRLIHNCVQELSSRAEDKGIRVETAVESIIVQGDEALLTRMLTNLLGNALSYTPSGGSVRITLTRTDGHAVLRMADTGPGIPAADRERVFERFVRLDPARGSGGAGLGLAIARWVAEAHGGVVRVAASGPDGTTFAASLPA